MRSTPGPTGTRLFAAPGWTVSHGTVTGLSEREILIAARGVGLGKDGDAQRLSDIETKMNGGGSPQTSSVLSTPIL